MRRVSPPAIPSKLRFSACRRTETDKLCCGHATPTNQVPSSTTPTASTITTVRMITVGLEHHRGTLLGMPLAVAAALVAVA